LYVSGMGVVCHISSWHHSRLQLLLDEEEVLVVEFLMLEGKSVAEGVPVLVEWEAVAELRSPQAWSISQARV
jgi:hypothetical protein